jgi:hypothetical protein
MLNNIKKYFVFLFIFFGSLYPWPKNMVVIVPVADLRNERSTATDLSHSKMDNKQLSQLVFGEKIIANKEVDGYLHISAIGQQIYNKDKKDFIGCPGWIRADQAIEVDDFLDYNLVVKEPCARIFYESEEEMIRVLLGTRLFGEIGENNFFDVVLPVGNGRIKKSCVLCYETLDIEEENLRNAICKTAELFLDGPYTWGGRSIYDEELEQGGQLTGVDCSNLVALCYKVHGMDVPRNTRSQHEKCDIFEFGKQLKPADVVFTAKKSLLGYYKIGHVMLYIGDDQFIEAVGGKIREVVKTTGKERFGQPVDELEYGAITDYGKVYFGSFLISSISSNSNLITGYALYV